MSITWLLVVLNKSLLKKTVRAELVEAYPEQDRWI